LKFAVHRPGIPDASPRSHGVPRRDVLGRVQVGVADVPAGHAAEQGLALAAARCDVPARRATLARERGIDLLHPARRLFLQAAHQQAPGRGEDAPVQPGFGLDIPARPGGGAPGRAGHVTNFEVLDADHVEPPGQIGGGLLGPILARIRLPDSQRGNGPLHPGAAVRATPGPGQLALEAAEPALLRGTGPGHCEHLSGRQSRADRDAPVEADYLAGARRRDRCGDRGEREVPPSRPVQGDPVGLHAFRHGAGPAEPYPAGLGDPHRASLPAESAHMPDLDRDDTEAFVASGFAPGGAAVGTGIEIRHRLGEVPQRLLLHHLASRPQPLVVRPGLGELPALVQVAWRTLAAGAPPGLLLGGEVPYVPGVRAVAPKRCLLGGRRYQAVTGHSNIISSITAILEEVRRRFLPSVKAGVSTPQS
jgi:hypothetical protein